MVCLLLVMETCWKWAADEQRKPALRAQSDGRPEYKHWSHFLCWNFGACLSSFVHNSSVPVAFKSHQVAPNLEILYDVEWKKKKKTGLENMTPALKKKNNKQENSFLTLQCLLFAIYNEN